MFNKQLSSEQETLDNNYAEAHAEEDETPAHDYSTLMHRGAKPGVEGLPLITLVGAIIVGILMWAGIFAIGGAVLRALF